MRKIYNPVQNGIGKSSFPFDNLFQENTSKNLFFEDTFKEVISSRKGKLASPKRATILT